MSGQRVRAHHDPPEVCELTSKDRRWLRMAAKLAETSQHERRMGCVIVRGNSVLGMGVNSPRNAPRCCGGELWRASEHAEAAALRRTRRPRGAVAYVVRLGADGQWLHAQPCRRCRSLLAEHGVRAVWSADPALLGGRTHDA